MTFYTVAEIQKLTGKSQSTVLRFIRKLKRNKPSAVILKTEGKTRFYKVLADEVENHFLKAGKQAGAGQKNEGLIPKGYMLIPVETLTSLQEQLKAKDEQIKKLQEINYIQSGFIANVKMLTSGIKKKEKDGIIKIENKKDKAKPKKTSKKRQKNKKNLFQKIFGL